MRRHPLVALILRSRHYRILIGGFILPMTGAYTATLAALCAPDVHAAAVAPSVEASPP